MYKTTHYWALQNGSFSEREWPVFSLTARLMLGQLPNWRLHPPHNLSAAGLKIDSWLVDDSEVTVERRGQNLSIFRFQIPRTITRQEYEDEQMAAVSSGLLLLAAAASPGNFGFNVEGIDQYEWSVAQQMASLAIGQFVRIELINN